MVPPGDEAKSMHCPVCKEPLKSEFREDDEEWIWLNAVRVKDKVCSLDFQFSQQCINERSYRYTMLHVIQNYRLSQRSHLRFVMIQNQVDMGHQNVQL